MTGSGRGGTGGGRSGEGADDERTAGEGCGIDGGAGTATPSGTTAAP